MITVVMPTTGGRERESFLWEACEAILSQQGVDFELVVLNAGRRQPGLRNSRLTVVEGRDPTGLGALRAVNRAIDSARGDVLHFAADDDVMQPGTLASAAAAIEAGAAWTYGAIRYNRDGAISDVQRPLTWSCEVMQRANLVMTPTVFWSRRLWNQLGPFDETLSLVWDYELWARFGKYSGPTLREHVDSHYRIWPGQASETQAADVAREVDRLHFRWYRLGFGER